VGVITILHAYVISPQRYSPQGLWWVSGGCGDLLEINPSDTQIKIKETNSISIRHSTNILRVEREVAGVGGGGGTL
jgi:hypothetical protein